MIWMLWGILIVSAFLVSLCFPCAQSDSRPALEDIHGEAPMKTTVSVMGSICGWVILFRVLIAFLERWFLWLIPYPGRLVLIGMLELTNGCCGLGEIANIPLRFTLAAGFLSFGGLCVALQSIAYLSKCKVNPLYYLLCKTTQGLLSLGLCFLFCLALPAAP